MHQLFAITALLWVAALTPGPNNLVVWRAAGRGGMRAAMPAIGGIVLGGMLLLAVAALGADVAFAAHPLLRGWVGVIGALYLAWLGTTLAASGLAPHRGGPNAAGPALPAGMLGLVGFQFLNPKSWVMVLTVLAAIPIASMRDYVMLAGLFVLIPGLSLLLWAVLGAALSRWLTRSAVGRSVDVAMGAVLVVCAFLLMIESHLLHLPELPK